jgi:hypothetical protein
VDIEDLILSINDLEKEPCYPQRISFLKSTGRSVSNIEKAIAETLETINSGTRSFVIYGEPQSGKTEFMIALVCKLIDLGRQTIFIVMNDNTELENQNFDRFHIAAELNPTPIRDFQLRDFSKKELKAKKQRIIFCRKNANNLKKLIEYSRFFEDRVVIDDEADFATPNTKINKKLVTAINEHLGVLGDLGEAGEGTYIGVTATPARLDLNNTYANDSKKWVFLESHDSYKGRSFFFPVTKGEANGSDYNLVRLPDTTDDPRYLRHAIFRFLLRTAILNMHPESERTAYCMLIHTAGKTHDHEKDQKDVQLILSVLGDQKDAKFRRYAEELLDISKEITQLLGLDYSPEELWRFVILNIGKSEVLVINHKNDSANVKRAGQPKALFTFAIGGNIVSRGLTFENLLTFFFSRNVKGRLQQNTYMQRARMFGYRPYSKYFELCVPDGLFNDWADCFQDHEVSLRLAKAGHYVHVYGLRNQVTDRGAMDADNISIETSERPVGDLFELTPELERAFIAYDGERPLSFLAGLISNGVMPEKAISTSLTAYLNEVSKDDQSDVFLVFRSEKNTKVLQNIERYTTDGDSETIMRARGGIIHAMLNKRLEYDQHSHFLLPIKNKYGQARILYKPKIGRSVIQNLKHIRPVNSKMSEKL